MAGKLIKYVVVPLDGRGRQADNNSYLKSRALEIKFISCGQDGTVGISGEKN
jgi:hypothetical protein